MCCKEWHPNVITSTSNEHSGRSGNCNAARVVLEAVFYRDDSRDSRGRLNTTEEQKFVERTEAAKVNV